MALTQDQLLKQQKLYGQLSAGITGVGNLLGQVQGMQNQANQINTNAPDQQTDGYGRPQYNLGAFARETSSINPQGASGGEVLGGVASGASAGAAFGPWGAVVGGVIGGIGSWLGGESREDEERRKKQIAEANLRQAQGLYNASVVGYNNKIFGRSQYDDMTNTQNRMNNLYSFNMNS